MTQKHIINRLPILVLYPHSQCNCRCIMCDTWKVSQVHEIGATEWSRFFRELPGLGVQWIVLSGGEPLMHSDLPGLISELRESKSRITVLTNGLLLEKMAPSIAHAIDDLIVSLDGPRQTHDRIRGMRGAFDLLCDGIRKLREIRPDLVIGSRCTVQRENYSQLRETARIAKELKLNSISFLAADLDSTAFNRSPNWSALHSAGVALASEEIEGLQKEVDSLIDQFGIQEGFVLDTPEKLRRIVTHFRAHLGYLEPIAPECNAPWVSAVIESDGIVRPCFFHRSIGNIKKQSLDQILNSAHALKFREQLDIARDPVCRRCVCSLNYGKK